MSTSIVGVIELAVHMGTFAKSTYTYVLQFTINLQTMHQLRMYMYVKLKLTNNRMKSQNSLSKLIFSLYV